MQNIKDINKPNQPFDVIGRVLPTYKDGSWSFSEYLYENPYEKCYSNDDEQYDKYIGNPDQTIFFFYQNEVCVGQIRLKKYWNKYAFIEDIAVSKEFRCKGIGKQLIYKAIEWAREKDLCGLMLETQDVNLIACRFYSKIGFQIGAVDTMLYANFGSANEKAVFWYMKF